MVRWTGCGRAGAPLISFATFPFSPVALSEQREAVPECSTSLPLKRRASLVPRSGSYGSGVVGLVNDIHIFTGDRENAQLLSGEV
jgi:hypothetical protein